MKMTKWMASTGLVLGLLVVPVFAEETDAAIEENITEEEKSPVCEICQKEPCTCESEKEPELEEYLVEVCENCQQDSCICEVNEKKEN